MATKNRKQSSTSKEAQQKAVRGSFTDIKPPEHIGLDESYLVYFDNVIAEFAKSEWTQHQLEIACLLARTIGDLNQEQLSLRKEGYITERPNGTTVENPRSRIVKSLTGDILALRRSLALHARARSGEARDIGKKKKQGLENQALVDSDDDLIARPVH